MVRDSISEIMGGEDKWNPNLILKSDIIYKFNGSPAPLKAKMFGAEAATAAKKRASFMVPLNPENKDKL